MSTSPSLTIPLSCSTSPATCTPVGFTPRTRTNVPISLTSTMRLPSLCSSSTTVSRTRRRIASWSSGFIAQRIGETVALSTNALFAERFRLAERKSEPPSPARRARRLRHQRRWRRRRWIQMRALRQIRALGSGAAAAVRAGGSERRGQTDAQSTK
eukprot:354173-Chlamydomonas_euryale.AAC.10